MYDIERDIYAAKKDSNNSKGNNELIYAKVVGLDENLNVADKPAVLKDSTENGENSDSEENDSNSDSDTENPEKESKSKARDKNETAEDKKARKKAVKEDKAAKRATKIPKHVKKRKEKLAGKKK